MSPLDADDARGRPDRDGERLVAQGHDPGRGLDCPDAAALERRKRNDRPYNLPVPRSTAVFGIALAAIVIALAIVMLLFGPHWTPYR